MIAATNRDLEVDVHRGQFRKDLWYRLNVLPLSLPPLRDRVDDIPPLVDAIISKAQRRLGKQIRRIPKEVMEQLMAYSWPGNVRELENIIERALAICRGPEIEARHLPHNLGSVSQELSQQDVTKVEPTTKSLHENERDYIIRILKSVEGNKTKAAKLMGIDRVSLWRKLNKYKAEGLDVDLLFND